MPDFVETIRKNLPNEETINVSTENLYDRVQTGKKIRYCAGFFNDLGTLIDTTLKGYFDFVRKIPYAEDIGAEFVARPKFCFASPALDCKKKAVLMGAWFEGHGIPWRLVAISENPDEIIHHVFPQAFLGGDWHNADATYYYYDLFDPKPLLTAGEMI